jgi:hypothetical protein
MKNLLLPNKSTRLQTRFLGIALFLLVATFSGFGQSGKSQMEVLRFYQTEAERLLLPVNTPETKTSVVAAYLVHPMADADYSVCLKDSARHALLELRLLDQNLWREVLTGFMQKKSLQVSSLHASVYSFSVSRRFKKKMVNAFDRVSPVRKHPLPSGLAEFYDDTTYEFRWVAKREPKQKRINFAIRNDSYESGLIKLLDQMAADLKNHTFKEKGFLGQLK